MGGRKGGRRPKGGDDGQGGSRRGKKKGGHGGGGKDQGPTLKEAQRLEQKAEKNGSRGKYSEQALAGFRQAIEIYLALYNGGAGPAAEECLVGLAGCYMGSAECKAGYLSTLTHVTQEGPVKAEARFLAQQCSECYRKLLQRTDLEDREEVLVNLGNALSVWAENAETGPEVIGKSPPPPPPPPPPSRPSISSLTSLSFSQSSWAKLCRPTTNPFLYVRTTPTPT